MFGRKNYTREEIDHARATVDQQLAAYRALPDAPALDAFEPLFFDTMLLALDRPFVHRLRMVTGQDGNPLNEVEVLCESLMNNDGVLRTGNVIKLVPDQSVTKIAIGDPIRLDTDQFTRLADAFLAELEGRFL